MQDQPKYIISPVTTYDEDEMLFGTKVGYNDAAMTLYVTVWGSTEKESRERAEALNA